METRAGMSQVKFKVRLNVLLLCEFTAEQMVQITGLNPESVRTELQRMKQEGLLEVTRNPAPTDQKRKRGGQHVLYRLVSDPEKRLALSCSVETFYPEKLRPPQPTSRHYHLALRLLDQVAEVSDNRKLDLLHEAEEELYFALSEEGASHAPEPVRAHIELQLGRLAYLRGQDGQAAESFRLAHHALIASGQAAEAARAEEFLLCIEIRRRWGAVEGAELEKRTYDLLEVVEPSGFESTSPLVQLMADLLRKPELSQTAQDGIIARLVDSLVEVPSIPLPKRPGRRVTTSGPAAGTVPASGAASPLDLHIPTRLVWPVPDTVGLGLAPVYGGFATDQNSGGFEVSDNALDYVEVNQLSINGRLYTVHPINSLSGSSGALRLHRDQQYITFQINGNGEKNRHSDQYVLVRRQEHLDQAGQAVVITAPSVRRVWITRNVPPKIVGGIDNTTANTQVKRQWDFGDSETTSFSREEIRITGVVEAVLTPVAEPPQSDLR